jgi:CBS domain-containing protein
MGGNFVKAKDVMITDVYVAKKENTVEDVLRKFADYRIGGMPIVDNDSRVVGYISDGDIMRFLGKRLGHTQAFLTLTAEYVFYVEPDASRQAQRDELRQNFLEVCKLSVLEVGVKRAVCVQDDEDLQDVARILGQKKFKKVPVLRGQQLVGIISRGDVIRTAVRRFLSH